MQRFIRAVVTADYALFWVGGLGLAIMMLVTLTDVVMRYVGRPIFGSMEIICFTSAIVIGFAIPYTSWTKGHIIVDFLLDMLSPTNRQDLSDSYKAYGPRPVPVCRIQLHLVFV